MAVVAVLGTCLFLLTSFVVGFGLVRLWTRTRQLPELMIGLSFLLAGGFGGALSLVGRELLRSGAEAAVPLLVAGTIGVQAGVICLTMFVGHVFRPGRRGRIATAGLCLAHALAGLGVALHADAPGGAFELASLALRIAAYLWATVESGMQWLAGRRRLRLGLADPAVVSRFLLWTLGVGSVLLLWLYSGVLLALGVDPESSRTATYLVIAVLGMTCAVSLWLAFFPPAAWRRRFDEQRPAA